MAVPATPGGGSAEGSEGSETRSADGWVALAVVVLSVGLAVLVTLILFAPRRSAVQRVTDPSPEIGSPSPSRVVADGIHVNEAGGYAFAPPPGWSVTDRGTVSELVSPEGDVVMSFGAGRPGPLRDVTADLVASIRREYDRVRIHPPERSSVERRPAALVGGLLVNDDGVEVRFLGLALRLAGQNRLIAVFVSDLADPVSVLPSVEEVIGSFEAA